MSTTAKQIPAHQENAQKSTGPITAKGKTAITDNALRHGILSRRLLLEDESEGEYRHLFHSLCQSLSPVGTLELTLVEKIAINLWRQRRLIRAEQAGLELSRHARQVADQVSDELGIGAYSSHRVTEDDLERFDAEHIQWCEAIIHEYEQLPPESLHDWTQLRNWAPRIHEQLVSDADSDKLSVEDYLKEHDEGFNEYLDELVRYCRGQIQKAVRFPVVQAVAELVKSQRVIPSAEARDKLARYQTILDNGLYKALKVLREAQQWRMAAIEAADQADVVATATSA